MTLLLNILWGFMIGYPVVMALVWLIGSLLYFVFIELKLRKAVPDTDTGITFLVPCYNEADTIQDTLESLVALSYPLKEIILINDGSSDNTSEIVDRLKSSYDFTFIDLKTNQGKAHALNTAAQSATYDYLMCIDADTMIDDAAPYYMVDTMTKDKTLGAVTGNPRIRNKSSLLAKIQTVEYASMIGSIKRAQTMNGYINTISGVFTLFRKSALEAVGYWDVDMITEDIAVSWKFHTHGFGIKYEPRARCWMLVPETFSGLWKQRIRWAQGGHEVLLRDFKSVLRTKNFFLISTMMEQIMSVVWVYTTLFLTVTALLNIDFLDYYYYEYDFTLILLSAFLLTFTNVIQFTVALLIDSIYEKKNVWYLIFLSWYPTFYWLINAIVVIIALPKALKRKKGEFATWSSPDRGNIKSSQDSTG